MSCEPGCSTCVRLRELALGIVGQGGIEALSLEVLATGAGLRVADDTYDELSCSVMRDLVGAFSEGSSWEASFDLARRRLLERMAAHPAEARLCFVETLRGDRELRRRRTLTRRWIVQFLEREHRRRHQGEGLSATQIELLIGAGFHAISDAVAEGDAGDVPALERKLAELADVFEPAAP
jgi:hypothetical protein